MREEVKKYLFIGVKSERDAFFKKAQEQGFIEFIPASKPKKITFPKHLSYYLQSLKILKPHETDAPPIETGDASKAAKRIIHLNQQIDKLKEQARVIDNEIDRVYIYGDFSLEDIEYIQTIGTRVIQFFAIKQKKRQSVDMPEELIFIGSEYDMDYFISISKEPKNYPNMIELHITKPLSTLQKELAETKKQIKAVQDELRGFAPWKTHIQNALIDALNTHNLAFACDETQSELDDMLFAVEAWMPTKKLTAARQLTRFFSIHFESIPIEKTDSPPTYLENEGFSRVGEDLVDIYDTPAADDKDPSPWVFWAFILFFSMIVADGGYGFIYLLIAFFLRYKFKKIKGSGKRFITLLTTLAVGCITWGVLTSSYFGIDISPKNPLNKYSLIGWMAEKKAAYHIEKQDDVYQFWTKKNPALKTIQNPAQFLSTEHKKDTYPIYEEFSDNILLELAIFVGLVHLSLSLMRYGRRNWANAGWICFMIGGYLYFQSHMDATSFINFLGIMSKPFAQTVGLQLVIIGLSAATILACIQLKLGGLAEITKVVQVFADTLSYLRLYALGLAGMMMASTFNELAKDANFFLGLLILIGGHALNFTMGAVGGIIHGLRLNFLEWYHYSFEGGGRSFNPLRLLKRR